jgi:hypothetical protein
MMKMMSVASESQKGMMRRAIIQIPLSLANAELQDRCIGA